LVKPKEAKLVSAWFLTAEAKAAQWGEVRIRNFVYVALAERGSGRVEDVPTSELDCLVNAGALVVLLPENEVGKLGLSPIPFNPLVEPIAECQAGVCKISA
jgi:hypothetical protein